MLHLIFIDVIKTNRFLIAQLGNPESAVLVIDGYTEYQCLTPKMGYTFTSKEAADKKVSNRLIGVKVTCGPIKKFFNYYAPDLVSGGANLVIEVIGKGTLNIVCFLTLYYYDYLLCMYLLNIVI